MRRLGKPFQRQDRPGWWIRWSEGGRRVMKGFHTKGQAETYWAILYGRINSDIPTAQVQVKLSAIRDEYLDTYVLRGLSDSAIEEARTTMSKFEGVVGDPFTRQIRQGHFDQFVRSLLDSGGSKHTVNKHIGNIMAFVRWASDPRRRYVADGIGIAKVKADRKVIRTLTIEQVGAVLAACRSETWRMRVLLSLVTGLRSHDIDTLQKNNVNISDMSIDTRSQKTNKVFVGRPLPESVKPYLVSYLGTIRDGLLFPDNNIRRAWESIRDRAGLLECTRHDLRRVFSTSIQMTSGLQAAMELMEHSSAAISLNHYTDQMAVLRIRVNQLPVQQWMDASRPKPNIQVLGA
jgi:integrase